MTCEPLAGWRHVALTERRTMEDFAHQMRWLADAAYPEAEKVRVVLDNLNTHRPASLYETFEPKEARGVIQRLEFHYTPKHGSWLNMAEIEFSVFRNQCLNRRIEDEDALNREIAALETERNQAEATINWRFSTTGRPGTSFDVSIHRFQTDPVLVLGDQLPASTPAGVVGPPSGGVRRSAYISRGTVSLLVPVVMVLQYPGLHQLEERGRTPGHQRHDLPDARSLDLARLAGAVLCVGQTVQACHDLEVGLVLAGGVPLGVAAAGLGAVADGVFRIGHREPPGTLILLISYKTRYVIVRPGESLQPTLCFCVSLGSVDICICNRCAGPFHVIPSAGKH